MKISNIIDIPKFIKPYINDDISGYVQELIHIFCSHIMTLNFDEYINKNNKKCFEVLIEDESSKEFINFYLNNSKLDFYYHCKYEDDKDIPKSLGNESFKVNINNEDTELELYIDSFIDNKLIMILS